MSKAHLAGRQAESNTERPDVYMLGGFEEDGRQVVKKESKILKAAEKPDFFMGGCGPAVPTGPKRKLKTSWLNDDSGKSNNYVEHVPKLTKKWTPVAKRSMPPRSKSHDGTLDPTQSVRKGRKPAKAEEKKEEEPATEIKKEEPVAKEEPATTTTINKMPESPTKKQPKSPTKKPASPKTKLPGSPQRSTKTSVTKKVESPTKKPVWEPPKVHIRKTAVPTEEDRAEFMKAGVKAQETEEETPTPVVNPGDPCPSCASKDAEIEALKQELEKTKTEKGELAKALKKTKGSQAKNAELKEQLFELKEQLSKAAKADANSKGFTKLENKLNTLKMIMDGKVDKNNLDDLKDHVDMLNMIINQDLRKEGMKNVWA